MRLSDIFYMLKDNFLFAFSMTLIIGIIFFLTIKLLNRNKSKSKITFSKTHLIVISFFTVYILTVLALTLVNRGATFSYNTNLSLFSSYKEAWYNFSLRGWQLIYFNIFMFVPFGFFLPLLKKSFKSFKLVIVMAITFTFLIESLQYITKLGIFELDDLFNNILGALIGYGIIRAFQKRKLSISHLFYLMPLIVVILFTSAMLTFYYAKDFGNLNIVPATKLNTKHANISSEISLSDERHHATVYKAPRYSKDEAQQFAWKLFDSLSIDTSNIDVITYQNDVNYRYQGNPGYHIWVNLLNQSFTFTDFSLFDDHVKLADADKLQLELQLKQFGISISEQASFAKKEVGHYEWKVDNVEVDNQLINGLLSVEHYNDATIKKIKQHIVTYEKAEDVLLISEQEAYNKIVEGKFRLYAANQEIEHVQIKHVNLKYLLDSKGFYQPVYEFSGNVNGQESVIHISAI